MKITRRQLRRLINEAILLELFDSASYDFFINRDETINEKERRTVNFVYEFFTESKRTYIVRIVAYNPLDLWDVSFRVKGGSFIDLTGDFDMKVYSTVSTIIEDFVNNQLPNLENESMRSVRKFEIAPAPQDVGDTRRLRLYQRMLSNYGIDAQNIDDTYLEFQV